MDRVVYFAAARYFMFRGFRSGARKFVSKELMDWADMIFVMEEHHKEALELKEKNKSNLVTRERARLYQHGFVDVHLSDLEDEAGFQLFQ